VHGREWSFASGSGVFHHEPKAAGGGAVLRESVFLGEVAITSSEVEGIVARLKPEWPGSRYNAVTCNCNSFSDELARALLGPERGIPLYVNRLGYLGSFFACCLPQALTGQAPVEAADGGGSSGGGSGGSRRGGAGGAAGVAASGAGGGAAWGGQAYRLDGTSTGSRGGGGSSGGGGGRGGGAARPSGSGGSRGGVRTLASVTTASAGDSEGEDGSEGEDDTSRYDGVLGLGHG
jgi:hypothetical protein